MLHVVIAVASSTTIMVILMVVLEIKEVARVFAMVVLFMGVVLIIPTMIINTQSVSSLVTLLVIVFVPMASKFAY